NIILYSDKNNVVANLLRIFIDQYLFCKYTVTVAIKNCFKWFCGNLLKYNIVNNCPFTIKLEVFFKVYNLIANREYAGGVIRLILCLLVVNINIYIKGL